MDFAVLIPTDFHEYYRYLRGNSNTAVLSVCELSRVDLHSLASDSNTWPSETNPEAPAVTLNLIPVRLGLVWMLEAVVEQDCE